MEPSSTDPITSFTSGSFDTSTIPDVFMETYYPNSQDSTLSSAPTDLLTPSAGSNPAELSLYNGDERIPAVYKKRKKVRQGYCWLPCNGLEFTASNGKVKWRCMRCPQKHPQEYTDGSSRNMNDHLQQFHQIDKEHPVDPASSLGACSAISNGPGTIEAAFARGLQRIEFNKDIFKAVLIQWIYINNISFRVVEQRSFRLLLMYLLACSSSLTALRHGLPATGATIRNWILSAYDVARLSVIQQFSESTFPVHFSFDLWSSPNHRAFFGLIGHWINKVGNLKVALLGMERFKGPHTGQNQAAVIWQVLKRYNLVRKVGYFTTDNATNNDAALRELATYFEAEDIGFDPISARIRCFGHIINLVVKGFLWGTDSEAFEKGIEVEDDDTEDQLGKNLLHWRKRGALGRLHNICTWILRSPQRRDRFEEKVQQLLPEATVFLPLVGNVTRWHGDVDALERAFLLREPLQDFMFTAIREEQQKKSKRGRSKVQDAIDEKDPEMVTNDELTLDDWDDLKIVYEVLEPFKYWTLRLEGNSTAKNRPNGFIADVLPAMDELLHHLEEAKVRYQDGETYSTHILTSINNAWSILNKYYTLTDLAPAMLAAVALHPEMKYEYFKDEWKDQPAWIEAARTKIENLWQSIYRNTASTDLVALPASSVSSASLPLWKQKRAWQNSFSKNTDQLHQFQDSPAEDEIPDLIAFWQARLNTPRWSQIARMALSIHSIPAMSAEVERVFSSSKLLISDRRNRLGDDVICAVECMKSWEKAGIVESNEVRKLEEMLQALERQPEML